MKECIKIKKVHMILLPLSNKIFHFIYMSMYIDFIYKFKETSPIMSKRWKTRGKENKLVDIRYREITW